MTTSAHSIVSAAAVHMENRAATYDKPEGERSIGATVAAYEMEQTIFEIHEGEAAWKKIHACIDHAKDCMGEGT